MRSFKGQENLQKNNEKERERKNEFPAVDLLSQTKLGVGRFDVSFYRSLLLSRELSPCKMGVLASRNLAREIREGMVATEKEAVELPVLRDVDTSLRSNPVSLFDVWDWNFAFGRVGRFGFTFSSVRLRVLDRSSFCCRGWVEEAEGWFGVVEFTRG